MAGCPVLSLVDVSELPTGSRCLRILARNGIMPPKGAFAMAEAPKPPPLSDEEKQAHKAQIDKVVSERLKEWSEAIKTTKIEERKSDDPKVQRHPYRLVWFLTFFPLLFAIIIKWAMFRYFGEIVDLYPRLREIHHQVAVLAFVVALAAYLANVSRETLKGLREVEVSKKEQENITMIRKNLAWVTQVEIHLVLLGIMTSIRLIVGSSWQAVTGYSAGAVDNFLLIYLAVVIVNLAMLHMRQWYLHGPFKAIVTIE